MGHRKCWFLMVVVFIAHTTALTLRDCRFGTQGCAGKGCLRFCEYVVCSQVDASICFCSRCGYRTMGAGTRTKKELYSKHPFMYIPTTVKKELRDISGIVSEIEDTMKN